MENSIVIDGFFEKDKKLALIADDDDVIVSMLFKVLTDEGWTVSVVRNGHELYALMNAQKNKYDIVITDIIMPYCDGYESVEMARFLGYKNPVIYLSCLQNKYNIENECFVEKPFNINSLMEKINNLTNKKGK